MATRKATLKTPEPHEHTRIVATSLDELADVITQRIALSRRATDECMAAERPRENPGICGQEAAPPPTMATLEALKVVAESAGKLKVRLFALESDLTLSNKAEEQGPQRMGVTGVLQDVAEMLDSAHCTLNRLGLYLGVNC